ncbi:2-amino-4-hydroxy-6-hydroxymethyldihydropteridine diphosphokinase [Pelistega sp. NLN82]|uniref:2-amino-4-hydroxy-6-hydroxymethyldihydropteridine pyrophosphokinase n=1 Tax=Pelistega ratti TaxID=2652177 RepID=A0A6L9Y5J7_9BURK|nr:2-amino-4-hydroxy-6-hydroxymethyldihydropteridine diphosphokinase [Pelistega ratti]NEN75623.1 2-amino-4-hydroxy-6-hydroxymethyldihydropteridine diphosphokinase [Pelistega ratti]
MDSKKTNIAYIGLGSNLGESENFLKLALDTLLQHQDIKELISSSFYRTSPVDSTGPDYINAVACLKTSLDAFSLLKLLQAIELKYGRERPYRNAPRTLDLDILYFNQEQYDTPELIIPHPRLHTRLFVLVPLREIAPDLKLPQGSFDELIQIAKESGQLIEVISIE